MIVSHLIHDPLLMAMQHVFVKGFGLPPCQTYKKLTVGNINTTYEIDNLWILQRVNDIFGPGVNDDIAALTPILTKHHVCVPTLCPAQNGSYCVRGEVYGLDEGNWRIMTKLPGQTYQYVKNIDQIRSLTRCIAAFHNALNQTHYAFKHARPGVHDFNRHIDDLKQILDHPAYAHHRLLNDVRKLYNQIERLIPLIRADDILNCTSFHIIHGDPKISNFMMQNNDATGVIDLDTIANSRIAFDVGDAVRSWCNPRKEDEEPCYNREYARETIGLYNELVELSKDERRALNNAPPFIALELSARFARDAIAEDYFAFNPTIGHGEHSLLRAKNMCELSAQMLRNREI